MSAGSFQKILNLDGLTPEPAIRSSDTSERVPSFDSCQLIKTLMFNMCALSVFLCSQTSQKYEIEYCSRSSKTIYWSADSFQINHVTSMSWHMSQRYGDGILFSGYPVLTAVNWQLKSLAVMACVWLPPFLFFILYLSIVCYKWLV